MDARSSAASSGAVAAETFEADADPALMEHNGITRVTAYQYWVDGYRYTNLSDALAQAERRRRADASSR